MFPRYIGNLNVFDKERFKSHYYTGLKNLEEKKTYHITEKEVLG